ncbi:MAG: hypothetical protein PHY35_05885 [Candidatus Omnitrophica bacterium]|nr:hypothetical protein [Candidatus Omnitrophota bacterium]
MLPRQKAFLFFLAICFSFFVNLGSLQAKEAKSQESGVINKKQPVEAGNFIYKLSLEDSPYAYTYLLESVDNNMVRIKIKSCPTLKAGSSISKNLSSGDLAKKINECCFEEQPPLALNAQKETILSAADGSRLLIRVIDTNKILVNEITVKQDSGIDYGGDTYEKYTGRNRIADQSSYIFKPVIYLYPKQEQKTMIKLDYKGKVDISYPKYDNLKKGWEVKAYPDGRIVNLADNKEYSYLFWEGIAEEQVKYEFSKGSVVKAEELESFFQESLSKMGLLPKEYNEFIVYWVPKLQKNENTLIYFAGQEYEESAKLEITPKPDSILRVFMVAKPVNQKIEIEPQEFKPFKREGFAVIEWGGTEVE